MCGIAGQVDFSGKAPQTAVLKAMAQAIARRGPDDHGRLVEGACALVHSRLSIIDVAGSPQPMATPSRDYALAFNGEIFNYQALREGLRRDGAALVTEGDTEVVLQMVARGWTRDLARLNGQFAFAVWDRAAERLLLARDPLGEKPLFYATPLPGIIVFGSELKAVLAHPAVDRTLNENALRQAVRFRAVYGESSLHVGVHQLRPGSWLQFDRSGVTTGAFFDLIEATRAARGPVRAMSDQAMIDHGRKLLTNSIRARLIADVPVGAFLSGGLDSSLIVAIAKALRGPDAPLCTFAVGFSDDPHTEIGHAQVVADAIKTRHRTIEVGPQSFIDRMAELSACRDGPVSEPADVAVAEMSRVARQSVKVVLSGEGADEVFAGYPKYGLAAAPAPLRWAIRTIGADRVAGIANVAGLGAARVRIATRALGGADEADRMAQWFSYMDRADLADLFPGLVGDAQAWAATSGEQRGALERAESGALYRMQMVDCLTWLPGNMLERGDRMTMAEGLEMRPPFLDTELAAFGLALPDRMKVRGKTSKWIVRQWANDLLPASIVRRKKWGFRVPLDRWFRGPLREHLEAYLFSNHGLCARYGDPARVRALVNQHMSGEADRSAALWSIYTSEVWYQSVFLVRTQPKAAVA